MNEIEARQVIPNLPSDLQGAKIPDWVVGEAIRKAQEEVGGVTKEEQGIFADWVAGRIKSALSDIDEAAKGTDLPDQEQKDEDQEETNPDRISQDERDAFDGIAQAVQKQAMDEGRGIDDLFSETAGRVEEAQKQMSALQNVRHQDWGSAFRKLLMKALSVDEAYRGDVQSRRDLEQFGRVVDVTTVRNIIFSFDCSGSMGPEKFQAAARRMYSFFEAAGRILRNRVNLNVFFWGSSYLKPGQPYHDLSRRTLQKIFQKKVNLGGTSFGENHIKLFQLFPKRIDLLLIFTDGEFGSDSLPAVPMLMPKFKALGARSGLIWILVSDKYLETWIDKFDPQSVRRRFIELPK